MALNVKRCEALKEPGRYLDADGLYLQISKNGGKSWIFRYERNGKERMMGLGRFPVFGLAEARVRANKARQLLADGVDPMADRDRVKAEKAAAAARHLTFKKAAESYFELHQAKWKNAKHRDQFLNTLRDYAFPVIGEVAVADISTGDIMRVLEPHWATKNETMNRVRSRIEQVLSWATVRGHRSGDNPARWVGHLKQALPARKLVTKVEHHAAMPVDEVPGFMQALKTKEGLAARALELTVLTATRTGEVLGATWDEIDLDHAVWVIPASRMKAGKEHRVALPARAVALLRQLPREAEFVFPGAKRGQPLSNMAMTAVMKRMERGEFTVHGFRSSFRMWASEQTNHPHEVIEQALAHQVKNKVERAYQRSDLLERRVALMRDWQAFTEEKPAEATVMQPRVEEAT